MLSINRTKLNAAPLNTRSLSIKTTRPQLIAILVFSLATLTSFAGYQSAIAQSVSPPPINQSLAEEKLSSIPKSSPATPASNQITQASDVAGNWAEPFIRALVAKKIIKGYPDGTFRPDQPLTRAEFAALLNQAFDLQPVRGASKFNDIPTKHWGVAVIQKAYQSGFLAGYPDNTFAPDRNITRIQSLVSLTNRSKLTPSGNLDLNTVFGDVAQVPSDGQNSLVAATQRCLAVSKEYDSTKLPGGNFGPNTVATRADVAAYIHQTLVAAGRLPALSKDSIGNKYIASCPQGVYVTSIQSPETPASKTPAPPSNQIVNADFINNLKIEPLATLANADQPSSGSNSPGLTFATPSAFGAGFGDVFIGGSASTAGRARPDIDGSMSTGFGLGSSNTLGVEVSYNLGSFKTFGANGSFDLKAHRVIYAEGTNQIGIAAGWNTFAQYGNEGVVPSTVYGAISSYSQLQSNNSYNKMPLSITVGAGGGSFRQGDASLGIFAGAGVQVHPQLGVGLGWSGVGLNAGLSFVPIPSIPLTIGLTGGDLGNNSPGGSVLVLNVGYGFNFLPR